jgi:hypothetical protein
LQFDEQFDLTHFFVHMAETLEIQRIFFFFFNY